MEISRSLLIASRCAFLDQGLPDPNQRQRLAGVPQWRGQYA
jgi:hypothetical protein